MYICRLFHRDRPFEQVEARMIAEGNISIGRDPMADWPLSDPEHTLSRIHCTLGIEDGRLMLRDCSTNGTFLGTGERVPREVPVALEARETLRLGSLSILIDRPSDEDLGQDANRTMIHIPVASDPVRLPVSWPDADSFEVGPVHRDTPLLEAFCEGAGLDVSSLSSEDPAELMRGLGTIYQQTIIGLTTLMAERTRLKAESQLERTTIAALENNPFKWAPARRLARELLGERDDGFLTGGDAVRAAFEDLADHLAGTASGAEAAIQAVVALLDPKSIEEEATRQGFSLKGRAALSREIHNRRFASLAKEGGPALHAFRAAYTAASADERAE